MPNIPLLTGNITSITDAVNTLINELNSGNFNPSSVSPSSASLGSLFAPANNPTDIFSISPVGYGPFMFNAPLAPPIQNPSVGIFYVSVTAINAAGTPGNDTTGTGTILLPFASITHALTQVPSTGGYKILVNYGTYVEGGSGAGLALNGVFTDWVSVESLSGQQDYTITDNASAGLGVIYVSSASVKNIQIKNANILPSAQATFYGFHGAPSSGSHTLNGLYFVNCNFICPTYTGGTTFTMTSLQSDNPMNNIQYIGCTYSTTGSSTNCPLLWFSGPSTKVQSNQPYTNIGMWGCKTASESLFQAFANTSRGINGGIFIQNALSAEGNYAFNMGDNTAGLSGGVPVPGLTNIYAAGNNFAATSANGGAGHGMLFGNNNNGGIAEFNIVSGVSEGGVFKGSQNCASRRNYYFQPVSNTPYSGVYNKASTGFYSFADTVTLTNTNAGFAGWCIHEGSDSVSSLPGSGTVCIGGYFVANGAGANIMWYEPSPNSTGGAIQDYNVYDLRSSASWGTVRSAAVNSLPSTQAAWAADGLTGDGPRNDANSQVNISGATGTRNDIVYAGTTGLMTYYAELVYQDGRKFTGLSLEAYDNNNPYRYAWPLVETTTSGTYARPLPFNLPVGAYTVLIRQRTGALYSAADPILAQQALSYAS